jgi:hypothetical protein
MLEKVSIEVDSIDREVNTVEILDFEEVIAVADDAVIESFSEAILK